MFGRYAKAMDRIADLAWKVAELEARLATLENHRAVGDAPEIGDPDKMLELANRKFADGLSNLLAFDGTPQEAKEYGDE